MVERLGVELWSVARRRAKAGVAEVGAEVVVGRTRQRSWLRQEQLRLQLGKRRREPDLKSWRRAFPKAQLCGQE